MTQKRRSPHKAGNGHKLAGWVQLNATTIGNAMLLILLAAAVIWQGVAHGH